MQLLKTSPQNDANELNLLMGGHFPSTNAGDPRNLASAGSSRGFFSGGLRQGSESYRAPAPAPRHTLATQNTPR